MALIVGIGRSDAGEQVLIALTGEQITIVERFLAEIGQQHVAGVVGLDLEAAIVDRFRIVRCGRRGLDRARQRFRAKLRNQRVRSGVALVGHAHRGGCLLVLCLSGRSLACCRAFNQCCLNLGHCWLVSVPEIHVLPP